jgi:hypothetical protein
MPTSFSPYLSMPTHKEHIRNTLVDVDELLTLSLHAAVREEQEARGCGC